MGQVPKGQVRIKEKVVINPQQSLKNNNIIGQDTTSKTQNLDTTGTIVTVRYRRFCFDTPTGGKALTQSSPCNAYKDSAVINQQGIAQYKFIANDKNAVTPFNSEICLDNSNPSDPRWLFKYENKIRIPIFRSVCLRSGYDNLGGDSTVWQTTIPSCRMYKKADEAMEYWEEGSYVSEGPVPYNYYFDSMIMAHEETHVEDFKKAIQGSMNKAYNDVFNNRPPKSQYPCAKNADDIWPKTGSKISEAYNNVVTKDKGESEQKKYAKEIATDEDARTIAKREKIYEQFRVWGRSKGWRDLNDNIKCP